ncbi:hypothetical protein FZO89_10020 [Luteimonas viscosa]|uniref:EF hand n=1 Tax=Luteimonas viscosa TaxID=1132694 RepID=A0A5D4XPH0_9GAMM|nr:hypothetical protein [Luteimonas viscosa]TYT26568.1 hypothetical protein FZO89_10020 [Luteimonas viscosa]
MKTTGTLALTALATAMAFGTAFAQDTTPPTSQTPVTQPPPNEEAASSPTQHDATGATHGSEHGTKEKASYAELDTRGDGEVAHTDLAAHPVLQDNFADIDADGDGTMSRSEYDAWKARKEARDGNPPQP